MENIDYKIFVPRGENNYVRFNGEKIVIEDILTVNIHIGDDKVTYWIYFNISNDDEHHKIMLKKDKSPKMILLIGNNPYEIHGTAEIIGSIYHKWNNEIQFTVSFVVINASKTRDNPRKEVRYERSELIDLRPIEE